MAPQSVLEGWAQAPAETREAAEAKMRADWNAWTSEHASIFADNGGGLGKTSRVSAEGASEVKNDLMLYAIVEGESRDDIAKTFASHPHFTIPQASIEIMEIRPL